MSEAVVGLVALVVAGVALVAVLFYLTGAIK